VMLSSPLRSVVVTPRNHPLSRRQEVSFEETLQFDYIAHEGGTTQPFLDETAEKLNKRQKSRIRVRSFRLLAEMVVANVGIGIIPEPTARRHREEKSIEIVKLTDLWSDPRVVIAWDPKKLPLHAQELLTLMVSDAKRNIFNCD
jgi:DNA-binding transcriptional LysR family regulator